MARFGPCGLLAFRVRGAYLSASDGAGGFALWRIDIADGQASVTPVAEVSPQAAA